MRKQRKRKREKGMKEEEGVVREVKPWKRRKKRQ